LGWKVTLEVIRGDREQPLASPQSADTPVDLINELDFRLIDLPQLALSLGKPDASPAAVFGNKLYARLF
jgi:hypothetical protein